jgi:protein-disulfide isomerase
MRVLLRAVPVFLLALLALRAAAADKPAASGTPVAVVGSQTITAEKLDEQLGNRLFRLRSDEYSLKRPYLDELISKALLDQEAASRKITVERLTVIEVDEKAKAVQDEEVGAVYESAKQNYPNASEAEARKQIAEGMRRSRAQQRRQAFIAELRAKYKVKILMEAPRAQFTATDVASHGPANAPVTIVGFLDFQCPYCANVGKIVDDMQKRYGQSLRFVFRHFPLPFHKEAAKASEAAICAQAQGKFFEMHDKMFANQRALQVADLKKYAGELGLNADAFGQCLDSGRAATKWQADVQEGSQFGVGGTPTLFVNGRLLNAGANPDALGQAVEQELASVPAAVAASAPKK